ncbi:caspase family protein [Sandarakinorhabdus sp.]|uniref:caspase family protein n=1 Tax=Sandarakinorhabdus sp. TaxID=1916663 RepID=UPI00286E75C5|nr:caspase family protein [Sandarakinorhabdus sp.]
MSAPKFHVLQVAINDYLPDVTPLAGCLNDSKLLGDWLTQKLGSALSIKSLLNTEATRPAVIAAFKTHLIAAAKPGDVALFHFAGHGARSRTAPEFLTYDADGMDEGLVCYDSRQDGGYDLADKELALLIDDLAATGAEVVMIFDCCHSGSSTREAGDMDGMRTRQTGPAGYKRELDSYLDGRYAKMLANGGITVPKGRHLLMAACSEFQKAKETPQGQGVFTTALVEVLNATSGNISYAELFQRVRAASRSRAVDQDPQFEALGYFNAWGGFLGLGGGGRAPRYEVSSSAGAWTANCGGIHGLASDLDSPASLMLYPVGSDTPAGPATVLQVGAQTCVIQPGFAADPALTYEAAITAMPLPPLAMAATLDPQTLAALDAALTEDASVGVVTAPAAAASRYGLSLEDGALVIRNLERRQLICGVKIAGVQPAAWAGPMLAKLKNIANWERMAALANPSPKLGPAKLEYRFIQKLHDGSEIDVSAGATLDFVEVGGEWPSLRGTLSVRNRSIQTLYVMLTYFSEEYGIFVFDNQAITPSENWITMWGDGPDDYLYVEDGKSEASVPFKLIVSTERVDDFMLTQDPLEIGDIEQVQGGTRGAGTAKPRERPVSNDWFTHDIRLNLVRRVNAIGDKGIKVADGKISIKQHGTFTAGVALASARPMTRDISAGSSNFWKAFEARGMDLVNFANTRGDDATILELSDIENADTLKSQPLEITIDMPLAKNEGLMTFAFDGNMVIPVGESWKDAEGKTQLKIDNLPQVPDNKRSLGRALKLYFFKTVLKQQNVNTLSWVRLDGTKAVRDTEGLHAKVAAASNILLVIHGIIGDTQGMVEGVVSAGLYPEFDLVLAYDYENLSTLIEDTATALKDDLAAVGIKVDAQKKLTILAHSMGGLVSRSLIEQGGGATIVDHLVMCGTPNNGSPFGEVDSARTVLTMLMGLAGNYVPALLPWTAPIIMALNFTNKLTPTLEQMNPKQPFLKKLNAGGDPGVRYTILAGDIDSSGSSGDPLPAQLIVKLGQSAAFDALFGRKPNDIAVSADSIIGIDATRNPAPASSKVACHHLTYFSSLSGQAALKQVFKTATEDVS